MFNDPIECWEVLNSAFVSSSNLSNDEKQISNSKMEESRITRYLHSLLISNLFNSNELDFLYLSKNDIAVIINNEKIYFLDCSLPTLTINSFKLEDLLSVNVHYQKTDITDGVESIKNIEFSNHEKTFNLKANDSIFLTNFYDLVNKLLYR
jgi:hypothetical protein